MRALLTWVDGSGPRLLQPPALPAPQWAQSSNAKPGKKIGFALFCLFLLEMR